MLQIRVLFICLFVFRQLIITYLPEHYFLQPLLLKKKKKKDQMEKKKVIKDIMEAQTLIS